MTLCDSGSAPGKPEPTRCSRSFKSTTLAGATGSADETAFLIHERLLAALGTFLSTGLGTIGEIFLKCSLHSHFPRVYTLGIEFETSYEFEHLVHRHAVAQHS